MFVEWVPSAAPLHARRSSLHKISQSDPAITCPQPTCPVSTASGRGLATIVAPRGGRRIDALTPVLRSIQCRSSWPRTTCLSSRPAAAPGTRKPSLLGLAGQSVASGAVRLEYLVLDRPRARRPGRWPRPPRAPRQHRRRRMPAYRPLQRRCDDRCAGVPPVPARPPTGRPEEGSRSTREPHLGQRHGIPIWGRGPRSRPAEALSQGPQRGVTEAGRTFAAATLVARAARPRSR